MTQNVHENKEFAQAARSLLRILGEAGVVEISTTKVPITIGKGDNAATLVFTREPADVLESLYSRLFSFPLDNEDEVKSIQEELASHLVELVDDIEMSAPVLATLAQAIAVAAVNGDEQRVFAIVKILTMKKELRKTLGSVIFQTAQIAAEGSLEFDPEAVLEQEEDAEETEETSEDNEESSSSSDEDDDDDDVA